MKKGIKSLAAAALALSALTPVVASASTSVENGVYTTTNFYTLDQFKALTTAEKTGALTSSGAVVVIGGKVYEATDVLSATDAALPGLAKDAATYTTAEGNKLESGKPLNSTPAPVGELKVESVSAINPTEIQVKFNQPVDSATARNLNNYVFTTASAGAPGTPVTGATLAALIETTSLTAPGSTTLATSELSADKKTVTLKLKVASSLKNSESYSVDAVNSILSDDKKSFVERHKDTVKTFNDLQAASLKEVTYSGTDLVLVFNEPITAITGLKVDDTNVSIGSPTYSVDTGDYTVVVPGVLSNPALSTLGNHSVVVYGAADTAQKVTTLAPNTATVLSGSYTVSTDTVKPTVVSIKPVPTNPSRAFDIEFSEPVTVASAAELELEIKKGTFVFGDDPSVTNADHYTVTRLGNTKTYRVVFIPNTAATNVNPLYGQNEGSVPLSVKVKGYKDLANNVGNEYTGAVTLGKDLVGPAVKDGLENRLQSTNELVVKFNKTILTTGLTTGSVDVNKIKVTDKDGIERTVATAAIQNNDEVLLTLTGSWGATELSDKAPYTVTVSAGAVQSVDEVKNAQTVATIKPHVASTAVEVFGGSITPANTPVDGVVVNTIAINYGKAMGATAFDLANYSLDNVKLNTIAGAKITANNANSIATITLPEGYTKAVNTKLLEISTNVKTAQGAGIVNNINDKQAYVHVTPLSFIDNAQPVLQKAEYLVSNATNQTETKRIKLTFSEAVTGGDTDDLTIKVGNATKAYTGVTVASGEPNALIVTLTEDLALTNAATITVNEHTATKTQTIVDTTGNVAKALTFTLNANTKTLDADAIAGAAGAAQPVITEIAALTVSATNTQVAYNAEKAAITTARSNYDGLSAAAKALVTNLTVLTTAETNIATKGKIYISGLDSITGTATTGAATATVASAATVTSLDGSTATVNIAWTHPTYTAGLNTINGAVTIATNTAGVTGTPTTATASITATP